jgi:CelD/BcsL family acetyltransferase involved in cellulose biosynthesis
VKSLRKTVGIACTVHVVSDQSEFEALRQGWDRLLGRTDATIFQTFEWISTWWKYFAKPHDELHVVVFSCDGRLVGIAPLFRERRKVLGIRIATCLEFIGRGLSDYVDLIIEPGFETQVLKTFAQYLLTNLHLWDIINVEGVSMNALRWFALFLKFWRVMVLRYFVIRETCLRRCACQTVHACLQRLTISEEN